MIINSKQNYKSTNNFSPHKILFVFKSETSVTHLVVPVIVIKHGPYNYKTKHIAKEIYNSCHLTFVRWTFSESIKGNIEEETCKK